MVMAPESQDLHIGFLCDYGTPLLPQSGIGVFVYNLIDGLLAAHPAVTSPSWSGQPIRTGCGA